MKLSIIVFVVTPNQNVNKNIKMAQKYFHVLLGRKSIPGAFKGNFLSQKKTKI